MAAAVIERNGRILIGRRKDAPPHPLEWEFPGGKVEPGETPAAALARELKEELAIDARVGEEIARYEYRYAGRAPILLAFFRVREFEGEPRNLAFERIEWAERRRLNEYDFLAGDWELIRRLIQDVL